MCSHARVERILTWESGEMCKIFANFKGSKCHNVTPKVKLWKFEKVTISRGRDHWAGVLLGHSAKFEIAWLQRADVSQLQANA